MSAQRLAYRYAKALIDLAKEQGKLESVKGDIDVLLQATENRDFYLMLKSPIVNATKKRSALKALFGEQFEEMTVKFMDLLTVKKREAALPEIAQEFLNQYKALKHVSSVKVTTAVPLSDEALEAIRTKLLESNVTESQVDIETAVDPTILGGFVVEIDDQLYDASVAYKLDKMRKEFA